MKLLNADLPIRIIFWGNIFLIVCCAFYLAWWLLAFDPSGKDWGFKTGTLLIPASIAGIVALGLIFYGMSTAKVNVKNLSGVIIALAGVAVYLILLLVTVFLFHRQVTSELFLIVGWAALAAAELNVLYGTGTFSATKTLIFLIAVAIFACISIVCYVLFYPLQEKAAYAAAYYDGMVPLIAVAVMTALTDIFLL